jgi:hypothetical protein
LGRGGCRHVGHGRVGAKGYRMVPVGLLIIGQSKP